MKKLLLLVLLLGLTLLAVSCGGGLSSVTSKVRVIVDGWDAPGALPVDHIELELWELDYLVDMANPPLTALSPEVSFGGLFALRYRVVVRAYDAGGTLLGQASVEVPVTTGETTDVLISLAPAPAVQLKVTPDPLWVDTDADAAWYIAAFDAEGRILLLPSNQYDTEVSPAGLASVSEGQVHGLTEGRGTLTITDPVSSASTSCDLIVDNPSTWYLQQTWGGPGGGYGQFLKLGGVAAGPFGEVYATDRLGDSITQFEGDGTVMDVFGTSGMGQGEFDVPWDVEVDWEGRVYISDRNNARVQVFNEWSSWLAEIGAGGSGTIVEPTGLGVDDYNLWVADLDVFGFWEGQLASYELDGFGYLSTWDIDLPTGCEVWDVVSDGWDRLYATVGNELLVLDSFGYEEDAWGTGVLSAAEGLALDASGNVYIADPDAGKIFSYSPQGTLRTQLSVVACDVALDRNGDLIAACADNYLRRYSKLPAP